MIAFVTVGREEAIVRQYIRVHPSYAIEYKYLRLKTRS